jgi:hypothetical protein
MESDPASAHDDLVEKMARAIAKTVYTTVPAQTPSHQIDNDQWSAIARAALAVARPVIREECARVAEADAKKSGWLVAAQLGLTEDEQKQFNQSAAKALDIAAAIRAMESPSA